MKWALIGDLQAPYHDKRAVDLFFKVMKWWKPDAIDTMGDIDDALCYSRFADGTTDDFFNRYNAAQKLDEKKYMEWERANLRSGTFNTPPPEISTSSPLSYMHNEAKEARGFYEKLRDEHPIADIHAVLGNHSSRPFDYIDRKAPELILMVTPDFLWSLDNLGIEWSAYDEPPTLRFGGIHVHHGTTTTTSGLAVKNDIESYNISLARGHDHRGGVVYKTYPMTNTTLIGVGTGHMCDPSAYGLRYTINPSWELGFAIGHVHGDTPHMQFIHIKKTDHGYECIVDGKQFVN